MKDDSKAETGWLPLLQEIGDWLKSVYHGTERHPEDVRRQSEAYRRRAKESWPLLAWIATIVFVGMFLPPATTPSWIRWGLALLLVPPVIMVGMKRARLIMALDEMKQRIELMATFIAFIETVTFLMFWYVLNAMGITLHVSPFLAFWCVFGTYWISGRFLTYRYR